MLALQSRYRFYLYAHPTDMRKSFDGLCGIVERRLRGNPLSGDVYVFHRQIADLLPQNWKAGLEQSRKEKFKR